MAGNSSISSFKILPRAAVAAAAIILCLEIGSWVVMRIVRTIENNRDLARLQGFFSAPLAGVSRDVQAEPRYAFRKYSTVRDMARHGPYDVIVIGTSVAESGWVEMLRLDHGCRAVVSALEAPSRHFLSKFVPVIRNYPRINNTRKAILLWVDITERETRDFTQEADVRAELQDGGQKAFKLREALALPSKALTFYCEHRIEGMYRPVVKTLSIDGRDELFYGADVTGLKRSVEFTDEDRARLRATLKSYKDAVAERGCIFAIAAFPTKPQQYEWLLNREAGVGTTGRRDNLRALEDAARENDIPFLDLEKELAPIARKVYAQDKRLLWNRAESHVNVEGNRYVARIMRTFLEHIPGSPCNEEIKELEKPVK